jgi:hypothetical protein
MQTLFFIEGKDNKTILCAVITTAALIKHTCFSYKNLSTDNNKNTKLK